ncbi:hypothetical protein D3C72_1341830 [compost metagenome]
MTSERGTEKATRCPIRSIQGTSCDRTCFFQSATTDLSSIKSVDLTAPATLMLTGLALAF